MLYSVRRWRRCPFVCGSPCIAIYQKGSPKMKTRNLSLATFVLGAVGVSIAACSAQSEGTPPRGNAGDSGGASAGAGVVVVVAPSAGASAVPSDSGGATNATGGAPPANGGAPPTTVSGGSGGAAPPATGSGGSAAKGSCIMAAGTIADLSIDDLEDGDNQIQILGHRSGFWYTYNDGTGMQTPAPDPMGLVPFKTTAGGHSMMFSAHTSGTAFTTWGAGMGFDFNNTAAKSCVYNASVYSGIKFWAKGNVAIKAMIKIPATTPSTSDSGTCTATGMCEDHYFLQPKPILSDAWTQYTIDFSSTTTFGQEGWGVKVPFDKTNIIAVQFQVGMGVAFDFSVDDITFY